MWHIQLSIVSFSLRLIRNVLNNTLRGGLKQTLFFRVYLMPISFLPLVALGYVFRSYYLPIFFAYTWVCMSHFIFSRDFIITVRFCRECKQQKLHIGNKYVKAEKNAIKSSPFFLFFCSFAWLDWIFLLIKAENAKLYFRWRRHFCK